ncbi:MAG: FtsQ-type POTRA domain-containing protein [Ruminiclostridium sp.]|nr:FtsQ-type POTRA domain-containing protein [Ruminiclostridium sp.]
MNKKELNDKLREATEKSAQNARKKAQKAARDPSAPEKQSRKQQRITEQTKRELPPRSPVRKQRDAELKKQAEREQREKRRHKRKRGSNIVYYIILAAILAITGYILSVTVFFNTEQIIVAGLSDYTDEQIIAASGLQGDENLVKLNTSGIPEKILDKLVKLDAVKVDKQFPSTIKITVEPAVPMASFKTGGKYYIISHIGRVMDISDNRADCMQIIGYRPSDSVIVGSFISAEDPEQDTLVSEISAALEKVELKNITSVDITDKLNIVLTYDDRVELCIGSVLQLNEKMRIANELLTNGYIGETERVRLDISDTGKAIQRPITVTTVPVRTTAPAGETSAETDENGETVETTEEDTASAAG